MTNSRPRSMPGPGPGLVAVLGLDLVQPDGQLLVGGVEVLDDEREQLLVGGAEQVVAALAVLQPEHPVAVLGPATRGLVGLAGQQRRELELLGAHGVHLLADDGLDVAEHPQPEGKPGVDAGSGATDVARPHEEPVARHLGIRRVVPEGAQEQGGHPKDHARKANCRVPALAHQIRAHDAAADQSDPRVWRRGLVAPDHGYAATRDEHVEPGPGELRGVVAYAAGGLRRGPPARPPGQPRGVDRGGGPSPPGPFQDDPARSGEARDLRGAGLVRRGDHRPTTGPDRLPGGSRRVLRPPPR